MVLDIFSGSNTTGSVAQRLEREWLSFELSREYAALSILRFVEGVPFDQVRALVDKAEIATVDMRTSSRLP